MQPPSKPMPSGQIARSNHARVLAIALLALVSHAAGLDRASEAQAQGHILIPSYFEQGIGDSVRSGLNWLVESQHADGSWRWDPKDREGNEPPEPWTSSTGCTGLALLALYADGSTPATFKFREAMRNGADFIVSHGKAVESGIDLRGGGSDLSWQAVPLLALLGRSESRPAARRRQREVAQGACDFLLSQQSLDSLLRPPPRSDGPDHGLTLLWTTMAVRSAQASGLHVAKDSQARLTEVVRQFLESSARDDRQAVEISLGNFANTQQVDVAALRSLLVADKRSEDSLESYCLVMLSRTAADKDIVRLRNVLYDRVMKRQSIPGSDRGSWEASEIPALRSGGRHFETMMNLLILAGGRDVYGGADR